jgi:hypothetical protein
MRRALLAVVYCVCTFVINLICLRKVKVEQKDESSVVGSGQGQTSCTRKQGAPMPTVHFYNVLLLHWMYI